METLKCADPSCGKVYNASLDKCEQCSLPKQQSIEYYSSRRGQPGGRGSGRGGRPGDRWSRSGGRGGGGGGGGFKRDQRGPRKDQGVDLTNPTVAPFAEFAKLLDARHDQHERIFKLSRDITIESKRVIFLLHRIQGDDDKDSVLNDAKRKLDEIRYRLWFYVGKELQLESAQPYLFLRAYTGGLQEYIEALSFYHYIKEGTIISWDEVQENLTFRSSTKSIQKPQEETPKTIASPSESPDDISPETSLAKEKETSTVVVPESSSNEHQVSSKPDGNADLSTDIPDLKPEVKGDSTSTELVDETTADQPSKKPMVVLVPKMDFLLGIADLTGEMMRKAITSAAAGNTCTCFTIFGDLQKIRDSYSSLSLEGQREMYRKLTVLDTTLKKVEHVCYNINVRSTEIPKHLIGTFIALHEATAPYSSEPKGDSGADQSSGLEVY